MLSPHVATAADMLSLHAAIGLSYHHTSPNPAAVGSNRLQLENFSLLHQLVIHDDFENEDNIIQINQLLSELAPFHKSHNKAMTFVHLGNSKPTMRVPIHVAKLWITFHTNEKRTKWFDSIFHFIATSNKKEESDTDTICSWLLRYLHKNYSSCFLKYVLDSGFHIT